MKKVVHVQVLTVNYFNPCICIWMYFLFFTYNKSLPLNHTMEGYVVSSFIVPLCIQNSQR